MTDHAVLPTADHLVATATPGLGRRAIDRLGPLRALVKSGPGQRLIQTGRGAGVVREGARFAARELRGAGVATYHLRGPGVPVTLRHGTRDIALLNEIFGGTGGAASCYEPPPDVTRRLGGRPAPRILDLGANIGLFGVFALTRWPAATLIAYEPDTENAALLARTIADNGMEARWAVVPAAVSNADGVVSFVAGSFSESRIAAPGETGTADVASVDLFGLEGDLDLIKMDIEGGEWEILRDPRLSTLRTDVVVLEWHTRNAPGPDAAALLRRAGFVNTHNLHDDGPDVGVLWAWRRTEDQPSGRR